MDMMEDETSVNKQMENFIAQQQQLLQSDHASKLSEDGDDSSLDELANGEVLHCLFPGCLKGMKNNNLIARVNLYFI